MGFLLLRGFYKSLAMTVLSEIGDKTFFAAAILAMHHPRRLVLIGCLGALIVMTIISVFLGWAAPNMISRQWIHNVATVLFFVFGLWSLWEGFTHEGFHGDLDEVEVKLNADFKITKAGAKTVSMGDDFKKQQRPFLAQFLSPIFLKIATIGLATDENPFGVVLGGIIGQALCTTAAVLGGKGLASQVSEKVVALFCGILFLVFGIQSLLSSVQ